MQPRRTDRRGHVHPVVEHVHDRVDDGRADAVGPAAPEHQLRPGLAEHHRRAHHARHPAAWRVAVEAEWVEVLLAEHVVEVEAGPRHDDPRPLAVGARHAAGAAGGVEHRHVRGRAEPRGEEAVEEAPVVQAVEEFRGALVLGGGHDVHEPRRRERLPGALEERQCVGDQRPAGGRRRVGDDIAPTVGHPHRLAVDHPVGREVGGRQHRPPVVQPIDHGGRHLARIEGRGAVAPQQLERRCEIGVAERVALAQQPALGREQGGTFGRRRGDLAQDLDHVGLHGVDLDPAARQGDGRGGQLRQRQ